jgi:hypothetical protein
MDAIKELKWLIIILVLLWVVWFMTGGPQRIESMKGFFIKPPSPIDTGQVYGPK